jgi:exodeoxyribonuclease V gamma subunit
VRWGLDARYRRDDGVFSWEFGIQRMLMGIMQPVGQDYPVLDVAPYGDIEGAGTLRVADALLRIMKQLENWARFSRAQHTAETWKEQLNQLLAGLLPEDENIVKALLPVQRAIDRLSDAGEEEEFPLDVVADSLKAHIRERTAGAGFRKGGVTFSTMVPVRHLPFRFIAVLGLNESAFPGREQASGFDLMQHQYRPGDRQKRLANRSLFLDALLTAGQRLHLSYEGFDMRDGQAVPPSPVLAELREVLEPGTPEEESALLVAHRLHGFHPDYMSDEAKKFTYDASRPRLLQRLQKSAAPESALERFDTEIPGPEGEAGPQENADGAPERITLTLDELYFFLKHPLRWVMERRMGMRQPRTEEQAEGRDVFKWDQLQKYQLQQELLNQLLDDAREAGSGMNEDELRHYFRRKGLLPYRDMGSFSFAQQFRDMKGFLDQIPQEYRRFQPGAARLESYSMMVNQTRVNIQQRVHGPVEGEHIIIDHAEAKPKRVMAYWLHHLFSSLTTEPEMKTRYISLKKDSKAGEPPYKMMVFEPDDAAAEQLQELVATYMNCRELPPPFTPEALARLHAADTAEEKDREKMLNKFRSYFQPSDFEQSHWQTVYSDDPYAKLFHQGYREAFEGQIRELKDRFWARIKLEERD